jgi:hypothetical protein
MAYPRIEIPEGSTMPILVHEPTTPAANDSIFHEAQGNLSFLLSVIRCGEKLSDGEEKNVRRVIDRLTEAEKHFNDAMRLISPCLKT